MFRLSLGSLDPIKCSIHNLSMDAGEDTSIGGLLVVSRGLLLLA